MSDNLEQDVPENPREDERPGRTPGSSGGGLEFAAFAGASDGSAILEPGHVLSGQFEVLRLIGRGGMGVVYEARDRLTEERVALKTLLPSYIDNERAAHRFVREIKTARRLRHPNIVTVHDIRQDGPLLFYTMELLEGRTVRDLMQERGRIPLDEALRMLEPLCDALAYAHQFMVHRDISPENMFLLPDGTVKLLDFGLARDLRSTTMTAVGIRLGKPHYMAPEQRVDATHVDARADIYALGVLLFEMLTGQLPIVYRRATELVPGLPAACDDLFSGALCAVEERFPDIAALREALRRCNEPAAEEPAAEEPAEIPPEKATSRESVPPENQPRPDGEPRPRERPRRWMLALPIPLATVIALALIYAYGLLQPREESAPDAPPATAQPEPGATPPLQGDWYGQEIRGSRPTGNWTASFTGNRFTINGPDEFYEGTFTTDPEHDPPRVTLLIQRASMQGLQLPAGPQGTPALGTYDWEEEGESIIVAMNAPGGSQYPDESGGGARRYRLFPAPTTGVSTSPLGDTPGRRGDSADRSAAASTSAAPDLQGFWLLLETAARERPLGAFQFEDDQFFANLSSAFLEQSMGQVVTQAFPAGSNASMNGAFATDANHDPPRITLEVQELSIGGQHLDLTGMARALNMDAAALSRIRGNYQFSDDGTNILFDILEPGNPRFPDESGEGTRYRMIRASGTETTPPAAPASSESAPVLPPEVLASRTLRDSPVQDHMAREIARGLEFVSKDEQFEQVVIGRVELLGEGDARTGLQFQSTILPGGYFAAVVGDVEDPLSFRMHGYEPLDVPLFFLNSGYRDLGTIQMQPVSPGETASVQGVVRLEGQTGPGEATVTVNPDMARNTPGNASATRGFRFENSAFEEDAIPIQLGADGVFQAVGFSPIRYVFEFNAPGHVGQRMYETLRRGATKDFGTIVLARPLRATLRYVGIGLATAKTDTMEGGGFWQPSLSGNNWGFRVQQEDNRLELDSSYGPWYAAYLGPGPLESYPDASTYDLTQQHEYMNPDLYLEEGQVWIVKVWEGWMLLEVVNITAP